MRPDQLCVITAISNPCRWRSRIELFKKFADHMLSSGVTLTVAECAYGDRPFECIVPGVTHVPIRAKTVLWVKENLLNIAISRLPMGWENVAWIDADLYFRNPDWASNTVEALQQYDVVQPWRHCYDLGPNGEHIQAHESFASFWATGRAIRQGPNAKGHDATDRRAPIERASFAHPGYAWAATRRAIDTFGGLIDTAIVGAADHHMAMGLIGRAPSSIRGDMPEAYRRPIMRWQERASALKSNLGFVPGTIEHGYHGPKQDRGYISRWEILSRNSFDPDLDLVRNSWQLWELAGNKPELRRDIDMYMRSRNEDFTVL